MFTMRSWLPASAHSSGEHPPWCISAGAALRCTLIWQNSSSMLLAYTAVPLFRRAHVIYQQSCMLVIFTALNLEMNVCDIHVLAEPSFNVMLGMRVWSCAKQWPVKVWNRMW